MKTLIKLLVATAVLLVLAVNVNAQQNQQKRNQPTTEEKLDHVISIIEKKVVLDEKNKTEIEKAFIEFFNQVEIELNKGERPNRSVMEALEKERDQKVKLVLSEEQFEDYLRVSCQLRPKPRQHENKPPEGKRPNM